jgi:hypothetical protein
VIVHLQVRLEVVVTRLGIHEVLIEYPNRAFPSTGTLAIDDFDDVIRTADITEVLLHALAHAHSSVQGSCHDEYFVGARTSSTKVVRLAY